MVPGATNREMERKGIILLLLWNIKKEMSTMRFVSVNIVQYLLYRCRDRLLDRLRAATFCGIEWIVVIPFSQTALHLEADQT